MGYMQRNKGSRCDNQLKRLGLLKTYTQPRGVKVLMTKVLLLGRYFQLISKLYATVFFKAHWQTVTCKHEQ